LFASCRAAASFEFEHENIQDGIVAGVEVVKLCVNIERQQLKPQYIVEHKSKNFNKNFRNKFSL